MDTCLICKCDVTKTDSFMISKEFNNVNQIKKDAYHIVHLLCWQIRQEVPKKNLTSNYDNTQEEADYSFKNKSKLVSTSDKCIICDAKMDPRNLRPTVGLISCGEGTNEEIATRTVHLGCYCAAFNVTECFYLGSPSLRNTLVKRWMGGDIVHDDVFEFVERLSVVANREKIEEIRQKSAIEIVELIESEKESLKNVKMAYSDPLAKSFAAKLNEELRAKRGDKYRSLIRYAAAKDIPVEKLLELGMTVNMLFDSTAKTQEFEWTYILNKRTFPVSTLTSRQLSLDFTQMLLMGMDIRLFSAVGYTATELKLLGFNYKGFKAACGTSVDLDSITKFAGEESIKSFGFK